MAAYTAKISPESELVEQLKKGEKTAIHQWYRLFSPDLRRFFGNKTRLQSDIDELVQDTFLSCLSALPLFRGNGSLWGWMLGIARHELADYYRRLYAKKVIAALPLGDQLLDVLKEQPSELHDVVVSVLQALPHAVSELLQKKYIDNLSVDQIALELEEEPHAVQGKLYRARKAFRKLFEEMVEE